MHSIIISCVMLKRFFDTDSPNPNGNHNQGKVKHDSNSIFFSIGLEILLCLFSASHFFNLKNPNFLLIFHPYYFMCRKEFALILLLVLV